MELAGGEDAYAYRSSGLDWCVPPFRISLLWECTRLNLLVMEGAAGDDVFAYQSLLLDQN
jgi:hypothetical protein